MELREWLEWYDKIRAKFGYSIVNDQNAAQILSKLIRGREVNLNILIDKIKGKNVVIFGAGPSLEEFDDYNSLRNSTLIACDGATEALLEHDIKPDIVVTDLDGDHRSLLEADRLGSIMVVHAHEDNVNLMLNLVPKFKNCIGTTQVKPLDNVYNFGGFTDGDRAVFLADTLGAKSIILIGMDFGYKIGRYSKRKFDPNIKIEKLKMAKELIEYLANKTNSRIYNLSSSDIKGYKKISIKDLKEIIELSNNL
ncbi:MAG: hypothetical protein KatS3mg003_1769 [Candidatus Nitrosocaldaceae archaeon]|nr:MAG: hypothetical protein KatS3mg003_1769 [Candidatus Nitrosocaldaceae archaeon]